MCGPELSNHKSKDFKAKINLARYRLKWKIVLNQFLSLHKWDDVDDDNNEEYMLFPEGLFCARNLAYIMYHLYNNTHVSLSSSYCTKYRPSVIFPVTKFTNSNDEI